MRILATLVLVSLSLTACSRSPAPAQAAAQAGGELKQLQVKVEPVQRERAFDGVLEAVNQSTVAAQTAGRVLELNVDVNDTVQKGQVLLRLRDAEPRAQLSAARAAYEEAQAQYERVQAVYDKQLVARAQMDRATAARDRARAALDTAQEQEGNAVIRAPYAGIVTARQIQVGELAVPGRPVVSLLSLDKLRVVIDVPQSFMPALRNQAGARVLLPDGATLPAGALTVFPYADEHSHTFRVRVELPEAGSHGVYPGQLVKVQFAYRSEPGLMVPGAALVRRGELSGLYLVTEKGALEFRAVRPGAQLADGRIEILSGLAAGEHVALDPVAAAARILAQQASAP